MTDSALLSYAEIEPRLRQLLPADLYASAWIEPNPENLERVFEHLRTLYRILNDYMPRQVATSAPHPGEMRHKWQHGTLMFTDLAGFTPLMEASAAQGQAGAQNLLNILNGYFAEMIDIISKSGGNLLEFTGDALLAEFPLDERRNETAQAVRAGLRMERAMANFTDIRAGHVTLSLGMRIGLHTGRYLTADIGTPRRMEHVLLGSDVQRTKLAEGASQTGRVCLTTTAHSRVAEMFRFGPGKEEGYVLVNDDLSDDELGTFDITPSPFRTGASVLLDRSMEGLLYEIHTVVRRVEPLACFVPSPVLNLLVETAATRHIPPDFPEPTIMFVNLRGLPESTDLASPNEIDEIVDRFSHTFSLVNAAVEARGGVLKKVTYHLSGSDMMIMFGVPTAHTDDAIRAADTAITIREIIRNTAPVRVAGNKVYAECQIGIAQGAVFAAEIGEPRGRREFNVLGDTVNTAARLMGSAEGGRILITLPVYRRLSDRFAVRPLGQMPLKGKSISLDIFELDGFQQDE